MQDRYKLKAYYQNPNGTNDLEIVNSQGMVLDYIEEGCFGIRVGSHKRTITLKEALRSLAVSPCTDGVPALRQLAEFFPVVRKRLNEIQYSKLYQVGL